jgi:hypothetical protein
MSVFKNRFPVCIQVQAVENARPVPANIVNGNFTWSINFRYSISPEFMTNDGNTLQYRMSDIEKGYWIATNGGFAWRIYDIQIISDTVCKLFM